MPRTVATDDTGLNTQAVPKDTTQGRGEAPMTPSPSAFGANPGGSPVGTSAVGADSRSGQPAPQDNQASPLDANAAGTGGERLATGQGAAVESQESLVS
jgi:hypothetical protein